MKSTAEYHLLKSKRDEIWMHIHSLTDAVQLSPQMGLSLSLQVLSWHATIPWDLAFHASMPMMFAYGPKLYELQTWGAVGDGNFLLDSYAQAANLLSHKLANMQGTPSPHVAASLTRSAGSGSPRCLPLRSDSHSKTPAEGTKVVKSHSPSPVIKPQPPAEEESSSSSSSNCSSQKSSEEEGEEDVPHSDHATSDDGGFGGDNSISGNSVRGGSTGSSSTGSSSDADDSDEEEVVDAAPEDHEQETEASSITSEKHQVNSDSSESEVEIPVTPTSPVKADTEDTPSKGTRSNNPSSSQAPPLPDCDNKDTEEEKRTQCCKDAQLLNKEFGKWHDSMIRKGHADW